MSTSTPVSSPPRAAHNPRALEEEDAAPLDKEPVTLFSLPGEIRNYIYTLVVYHDENAGFIAPLSRIHWNENKYSGVWAVLDGKEEFITMGRWYDRSLEGPHIVRGKKESPLPQGTEIHPYHGHFCQTNCLAQPALTRVSRQVREESLPFFYGLNKFHFESFTFYRTNAVFERAHGTRATIVRNPGTWWRRIGDSNLRMIKALRIIDRIGNGAIMPSVDLEINRTGGSRSARLLEGRRGRDASRATPEMQECMAQMQADGPFVRGIEKALLKQQTLGITTADWPKMEDRRIGLIMVGNAKGLGDKWIFVAGGDQDSEAGPKVTYL